jgi:hypothetical protein
VLSSLPGTQPSRGMPRRREAREAVDGEASGEEGSRLARDASSGAATSREVSRGTAVGRKFSTTVHRHDFQRGQSET